MDTVNKFLKLVLTKVIAFLIFVFKKEVDAIKYKINGTEFVKAIVSGLLAGGGVLGFLAVIQAHLSLMITDPEFLSQVQHIITLIVAQNWTELVVFLVSIFLFMIKRYLDGEPEVPKKSLEL